MPKLVTSIGPPTNKKTPVSSHLANKIAQIPQEWTNERPLWKGPCAQGPLGGITQSMLQRFLSCRERFRIKYVLGLEPPDQWQKTFGFGNMWHVCEEALAKKDHTCVNRSADILWIADLTDYAAKQLAKYPMQREEIEKWYMVCRTQFPEYVKYWSEHPDVKTRTPLMQEQVFDVPYTLPSGRVVRLRGKWDAGDIIDNGIYQQENKSKSQIDKVEIERQLKFDLQTMMYQTAMIQDTGIETLEEAKEKYPINGVRYNVVRRDLPIRKHKEKCTKPRYGTGKNKDKLLDPGKITPAETDEHFYERFRADYVAANPDEWFFRVRSEVSDKDVQEFQKQTLDPLLEQLCFWYDEVTGIDMVNVIHDHGYPPLNFRMPFGIYNMLTEQGFTEYDAFLESGSRAGLRQVDTLFTELQ